MASMTWRRRPRSTAGMAVRAAREISCLRSKKPRLWLGTAVVKAQVPLEATQNEPMTLLASSHKHVADVGGTCCWLSGSDARQSVRQVRAALVASSLRALGAVTSPSVAKTV